MAPMSMNKAIHGAVRRDLDRFAAALASARSGDAERAAALGRAWANFEHQLTHHHEAEHRIAWPGLIELGVSPELLSALDVEHESMADALASAGSAMDAYERSPGAAEIAAAGAAVGRLSDVTAAHLDHEEAEIEPVYQRERDSEAMKRMGKAFGRDQSMTEGGTYLAWLLDGATPQERAGITASVPGPVVSIVSALFGRRYRSTIASVWSP